MGSRRDWFGETLAPAFLMGGAAVTGFRSFNEIQSNGGLSKAWRRMANQKDLIAMMKQGQTNLHHMKPDDVAALFFHPTVPKSVMTREVANLVQSYQLHPQLNAMGLGTDLSHASLEGMDSTQLSKLLSQNPSHVQHMTNVARSYGLSALGKGTGYEDEAARTTDLMNRIERNLMPGPTGAPRTLADSVKEGRLNSLTSKSRMVNLPTNPKQFQDMMDRIASTTGSGTQLSTAVSELHQIAKTQGMTVRLKMLTRGGQEFIGGVQLARTRRHNGKVKHAPLVNIPVRQGANMDHVVFVGDSERKMVARMVQQPESVAEAFFKGLKKDQVIPRDVLLNNTVQHFDVGAIRRLADPKVISNLTQSRGGAFEREFIGDLNTDNTKALIPWSNNPLHNRRVQSQATFSPMLGSSYSDENFNRLREAWLAAHHDPVQGVSAAQMENRVISLPPRDGGLNPLGMSHTSPTSPKAAAQQVRPNVLRGEAIIEGAGAVDPRFRARGEAPTFIRTYSTSEEGANRVLRSLGRADKHLHPDEHIMTKRLYDAEPVSFSVHRSSSEYGKLHDLIGSINDLPGYAEKLRDGVGPNVIADDVGEQINLFREKFSNALADAEGVPLDAPEFKALQMEAWESSANVARHQNLLDSLTFTTSNIIGDAPEGGLNSIEGTNRTFRVGQLQYNEKTEMLHIGGEIERPLTPGSKLHGSLRGSNAGNWLGESGLGRQAIAAAIIHDEGIAQGATPDDIETTLRSKAQAVENNRHAWAVYEADQERGIAGTRPKRTIDETLRRFYGQAWDEADRYSAFEAAGIKKIEEKGAEPLMESMFDRLRNGPLDEATEHMALLEGRDGSHVLAAAEAASIEVGIPVDEVARRMDRVHEIKQAQEFFQTNHEANQAIDTLEGVGYKFGDGKWQAIADFDKYNPATRMDTLMSMMMDQEKGWNSEVFMRDLATSEAFRGTPDANRFTKIADSGQSAEFVRRQFAKGNFDRPKFRAGYMEALEKQLAMGSHLKRVASGGHPLRTAGIGREASMNFGVYEHLQAQGGTIGEMANDIYPRISNGQIPLAEELAKHNAVNKMDLKNPAISIYDLHNHGVDPTDLFSINQEVRDLAFEKISKGTGIDLSQGAVIDLVEEEAKAGGRYRHISRNQSAHSGGFITSDGRYVSSELEKSTKSLVKQAGLGRIASTVAKNNTEHNQVLQRLLQGKTSATVKAWSGSVQGSMSFLAVSQMQPQAFAHIGKEGWEHKFGIRESAAVKMWEGMGMAQDEIGVAMQELREGRHSGVFGRYPAASIQNFSNNNAFSIDEFARLTVEADAQKGRHGGNHALMVDLNGRYRAPREEIDAAKARGQATALVQAEEQVKQERAQRLAELRADRKLPRGSRPKRQKLETFEQHLRAKTIFAEREELMALKAKTIANQHNPEHILTPFFEEIAKTADFDGDTISFFGVRNPQLRGKGAEAASHSESLWTNWTAEHWDKQGKEVATAPQTAEELMDWVKNKRTVATSAAALEGESNFMYNIMHRRLAGYLKNKTKAPLSAANFVRGSKEWLQAAVGRITIGALEKKEVGLMTNAVDQTRANFRQMFEGAGHSEQLAAEAFMGVLTESSIKAQQHGSLKVGEAAQHVYDIRDIMNHAPKFHTMTAAERAGRLKEAFYGLHKVTPSPMIEDLLKNETLEKIVSSAEQRRSRIEDQITKDLKSPISTPEMEKRIGAAMYDETMNLPHAGLSRSAVENLVELPDSSFRKNLKNATTTFDDIKGVLSRHKKPLIIGAGLAIATNMLLASPGNISSEEADAAGAKHRMGEPTTPVTDKGHSVSLTPGMGQNIKIRGSSNSGLDVGAIGASLRQRFSGSDISMNVADYRQKINEDYIRRRIDQP